MRDVLTIARRHRCCRETGSAAWSIDVLKRAYQRSPKVPSPRLGRKDVHAISPESLLELQMSNIKGTIQCYGTDWARFEAALVAVPATGLRRHPLVSMPSKVEVDAQRGSLRISAQTFIVAYQGTGTIFLTWDSSSTKVTEVSLDQMRLLHRTWCTWPVILPCMLLNVIWHCPQRK